MNHENYHSETYQNIGKSLYVFNELEFFINCIIAHYIKPSDREFFIDFFLNTSVTSFGTKIKMLGTFEKFTNKELDIFRKYANFRNVFAHSNRTHFFDVDASDPYRINIKMEDVIYITNSSGKMIKKPYSDFIDEHLSLIHI